MATEEMRYLELMSTTFPTVEAAQAYIIEAETAERLPKAPEFFMSDIHGEYKAFDHLIRSASGNIRLAINDVFGDTLDAKARQELATLVYYPTERCTYLKTADEYVAQTFVSALMQIATLATHFAHNYPRKFVRSQVAAPWQVVIEELMRAAKHARALGAATDTTRLRNLASTIVEQGQAESVIAALGSLIQRMAVYHLHMLGDVYDRGPAPELIMETLMSCPSIDIQWGNHDIVWMGAAVGEPGCIAHVVRNCARYGNLGILEDAYGINLRPLAAFAETAYADDPCVAFGLKENPGLTDDELQLNIKIQKAMAMIQFKVEAKTIDENPSFNLEDRKLLHKIDTTTWTVEVDGVVYDINDHVFPTVDWNDPYKLTADEQAVMESLIHSFKTSEKLQRHMRFLLDVGSLYKIANGNLLFHACVPLNEDGTLKDVDIYGQTYSGKALCDVVDHYVREAFNATDPTEAKRGHDLLWYLWLGQGSPLFAKSKMATFELYLIDDKAARKEVKNSFYTLLNDPAVLDRIFKDFGLDPQTAHIVCGHVPVKAKDGEDPVKGGGRVLTIDGGFSSAYQKTTGLAGYTLISNEYGLVLDANEPLPSREAAITECADITATRRVVETYSQPLTVADTDEGATLQADINDLKSLIAAYRSGALPQRA